MIKRAKNNFLGRLELRELKINKRECAPTSFGRSVLGSSLMMSELAQILQMMSFALALTTAQNKPANPLCVSMSACVRTQNSDLRLNHSGRIIWPLPVQIQWLLLHLAIYTQAPIYISTFIVCLCVCSLTFCIINRNDKEAQLLLKELLTKRILAGKFGQCSRVLGEHLLHLPLGRNFAVCACKRVLAARLAGRA